MYSINFTENNKKFCLSLHYNGANSYLFVNGTEIHKFKAKDSEIVASPLGLGNISKDVSVDNMKKKTGLNVYFYDFSVDYDVVAVDDILEIHKYLMEKSCIFKNVWYYKKTFISTLAFFNHNILLTNSLKYYSLDNQKCKIRPKIIGVNNNESIFYPYKIIMKR